MKTLKLILASALIIGAVGAQAQDSTNLATPPQPEIQQQTPPQTPTQPLDNFKKDMVIIQSSDIPASLRTTLQDPQYKGWESGTIYRNQSNDVFIVETIEGDKAKLQRFDKEGKPVKDY